MISIFKEIVGQAKTSLKPSLQYNDIKDAINERIKGRQEFDDNMPWMGAEEFIKRYRNVRISAIIAGVLGIISLLSVAFAGNVQGFVLSLMSFIVLELFYVKLNFLLWASRETVFTQINRVVRLPDYLAAVAKDPNQFLPLSLTHKVGTKQ
ncbi:hypothetical protein IFT48_04590 [Pseudomonas fluorescens]|uniref:hypothetical protein n=1 Tax=Pseudomonas TaxID=286 RepID=UPI000F028D33|nr:MULTISPECIES: hypothetical protein [Pseudomonas]MBD8089251.1 hypothetical protein [Pseudomonas fluorescens]MBD8615322.1 hypothetical protein [Pseudomonas putida]MBD8682024.1 hypothetical protein [Pseudomonas sp. CFBP 13719]